LLDSLLQENNPVAWLRLDMVQILQSLGMFLLLSLLALGKAQDGYDYLPPPTEEQLKPGVAAVEAELEGEAAPQPSGGGHGHADSDDPLAWLKESVPGEPGVDYPILASPPETGFTCAEYGDGMYADIEADCQPWHQCLGDRRWTFLCPNGTIFNQELFTCVWWFNFDCETAADFFSLNQGLYEEVEGGEATGGDGGIPTTGAEGGLPVTEDLGPEFPIAPVIEEEEDYGGDYTGEEIGIEEDNEEEEELAGYEKPVVKPDTGYGGPPQVRRTGRRNGRRRNFPRRG